MLGKSFIQFCNDLENYLQRTFPNVFRKNTVADEQAIITKHLQSALKIVEDQELRTTNNYFVVKFPDVHSQRALLKYCILSWSLPPLTQFELQEVLRSRCQQHHFPEIESYLYSKEVCYCQLFLETDYRLNDVFGNILQPRDFIWVRNPTGERQKVSVQSEIVLKLLTPRKPKRKIRRRGYNDHGSKAEYSVLARQEALREDEFLRQKQLQIELKRTQESLLTTGRVFQAMLKIEEWGRD